MKTKLTAQDWALCIGNYVVYNKNKYKLDSVGMTYDELFVSCDRWIYRKRFDECNPILRTLDQMTEEEKQEFKKEFYDFPEFGKVVGIIIDDFVVKVVIYEFYEFGQLEKMQSISIDGMDWLTQRGFDIRGWIEAGLAIKEADNDTK